jgi:hypothetical protein
VKGGSQRQRLKSQRIPHAWYYVVSSLKPEYSRIGFLMDTVNIRQQNSGERYFLRMYERSDVDLQPCFQPWPGNVRGPVGGSI